MISVAAHAKINLGLEVLHKRSDGLHEINTVFARVSLHDILRIESAPHISVSCAMLPDLPQHHNVVWRAATMLQREFSVTEGAKIAIEKHIPDGAGLGGGSSDAASALLALCRFWNITVSRARLHDMARSLGADVPFFLGTTHAFASGIGEVLEPLPVDLPLFALLVFPGIPVPTAWAYAALERHTFSKEQRVPQAFVANVHELISGSRRVNIVNDFEEVVFTKHASIAEMARRLRNTSCRASFMSGSGSTLVALFDSQREALEVSSTIRDMRSCVCGFVNTFHIGNQP